MELIKPCPVHASILVVGGKWKPCIIYQLRTDTLRFGELKRQMPWISEKVLIRHLKELEADGIVTRRDHGEVPPRVDYSLSDYGKTVRPLITAMADWGKKHSERPPSQ